MLELLEPTTAALRVISPAAVLCRVEDLLLRGTGATSVDAFLVDRWFNKLLLFSTDTEGDGEGREGAPVTAEVSGPGSSSAEGDDGGSQNHTMQQREIVFKTRVVCDIGEGVAGVAAMTGRKLRIRDCRRHHQQQQQQHARPSERSAYNTPHDSGSLVCWPVRQRTSFSEVNTSRDTTEAAASEKPSPLAQLEDVDVEEDHADDHGYEPAAAAAESCPRGEGAVLAVLQLHCAEGVLSADAVGVLQTVGRLLVPLLTEALARDEERACRRSAEALLSMSGVVPQEVSLVAMIEEVVRVAQAATEAERACLFFVDDAADELWVAKAVEFDDAKIKIGKGLCGHAAATGETVNVIDSYQDSRFDQQWDKLTGFVTKRCACVRALKYMGFLVSEACCF